MRFGDSEGHRDLILILVGQIAFAKPTTDIGEDHGRSAGRVVVASSSLAVIFGERSTIHSLPALFPSSRTLIPLFRPGSVYSGSAS